MRKAHLGFATTLGALLLAGCPGPGPGKPDLVVTTFVATGPATVNAQNSVELPVRAVIRNQGAAPAGIFKVSVDYTGSDGRFVVAFTVPGQASIWYPTTNSPLAVGTDRSFAGKLTFHPAVHGETVTITALADSCSGDEFMPAFCRVDESNETNNESGSISVALP
jgi:hypothetical protein